RRKLTENDVHKRDTDECERDRNRCDQRVRMNVRQRKERFDQMRKKFFTEPTERQTRHSDAELRRRKISVEMRANIFCKTRARVPLLRQFVELTRANFDDCEFARDEKSVQSNQRRDYR